jgi:putative FmdB family regulatory protein
MPLYEYECQSCGKRTEVLQRFADAPLTVCEACGGELKKLLSAPAVQFKGSGWYVTDYAGKKSSGKSEGGEGAGQSKEKDKGDSGKKETVAAEAKPAASSASPGSSSGSGGGSGSAGD